MDYSSYPPNYAENLAAFFNNESNRPVGLDLYDDVFHSRAMFPLQRKKETAAMVAKARSISPQVVMEIGSDKGGGFYHWIKGIPTVNTAIANDVRGCPFQQQFKKHFPEVDFHFLEGSSRDAGLLNGLRSLLGDRKIDVLFIDGDKSKFYQDFVAYLPIMKTGGIVFMHDIQVSEPGAAFAKVGGQFRTERIIDTSEAAAIREKYGPKWSREISYENSYESWLHIWQASSCGVGVIYV